MRLKLICCEILYREMCRLIADCPFTVDVEFMPKGLHDLGSEKMVRRLQERIDAVEPGRYEAILLGYALCNNGIVGLRSAHTRLVVPRAHDCITLLMGSRARYAEYFGEHPGTYYRSTGWYEREDSESAGEPTVQSRLGLFRKREELVAQYGEENAEYLMEVLGDMTVNYDRVAYIRMGLACDDEFAERARREAADKGWDYDELRGSMDLLHRLIHRRWDGDFLVLEPGTAIQVSYSDDILRAAP